jgi:hypothetical protein
MAKFEPGDRFARLTILEVLPPIPRSDGTGRSECQYLCRCNCGREKVIRGSNLRPGQTTGCGCGRRLRWQIAAPQPVTVKPVAAKPRATPERLSTIKAASKRLKREQEAAL